MLDDRKKARHSRWRDQHNIYDKSKPEQENSQNTEATIRRAATEEGTPISRGSGGWSRTLAGKIPYPGGPPPPGDAECT